VYLEKSKRQVIWNGGSMLYYYELYIECRKIVSKFWNDKTLKTLKLKNINPQICHLVLK
jgi:hypothetical protein